MFYCLLPSANEVCEGYVFTRVLGGGVQDQAPGGCLPNRGGVQAQAQGVSAQGVSRPTQGGVQAQVWEVCIPACTEADTRQQMSTAADGMHPTGIHSCILNLPKFFWVQQSYCKVVKLNTVSSVFETCKILRKETSSQQQIKTELSKKL